MGTIKCFVCKLSFANVKDFFEHFRLLHSSESHSTFSCMNSFCQRDFKSIRSFKKYLMKCIKRNDLLRPREPPQGNVPVATDINLENEVTHESRNASSDVDCEPPEEAVNISSHDLKQSLSKAELAFVAKLYASPLMNRAQVQDIVEFSSEFLTSGFVDSVKTKVFSMLENAQQTNEDIAELQSMFESLSKPFDGLGTEHKRMEALKEASCFIKPEAYILGSEYVQRKLRGEVQVVHKNVYGQHMSIRETLIKNFELQSALEDTLEKLNKLLLTDEPFTNVVQGEMWKTIKETHFQGKTVLPLFIQFDDFEPDNSLGAHAGDHKLGLVCFTVPCMPRDCLSSQNGIFQADLFLSENKVFGVERDFKMTIDDLIELEQNGIIVKGNRLYFCMCQIIGDNLGNHEIHGLVMGFTANFSCRLCKVHKDTLKYQTVLDRSLLRTVQSYDEDVLKNDAPSTGIRERNASTRIPSYHPMKRHGADSFHDFAEGGCQYGMFHVVNYLVNTKKLFDLETLNFRIMNFDYNSVESGNAVPSISTENLRNRKLKMSGSEMLCFVRYFRLMVGDYLPIGDPVWRFYLILREIVSIVFASFVIRGMMPYLSALITEHHELYLEHFGDTLKFKHHLWLHYPDLMLSVGPMNNVNTLRLERHHRPSKQIARARNSRVNLPYTIAQKQQLGVCARLLSRKPLTTQPILGPPSFIIVEELEKFHLFRHVLPIPTLQKISVVPWVCIIGTNYQQDIVIAVSYKDALPLFGRIEYIVVESGRNVKFLLNLFETVGYNEHLASYEVSHNKNDWMYLGHEDCFIHIPSNVRIGCRDACKYVTLRCDLPLNFSFCIFDPFFICIVFDVVKEFRS